MVRLTEEQKMILNCYEGGKTKVIREIHRSMEELESTEKTVSSQSSSKSKKGGIHR